MEITASNTPPARLRILFASDAPVAAVLRRGPTDKVQLIRWDTAKDKFEFGHWLFGRFHEDRADISPDGELLVYFAGKPLEGNFDNWWWTAISRPPFFTAIALWFHGDTWGGGGRFVSNRSVAGVPNRVPDKGYLPKHFKVVEWDQKWEPNGVHSKFQYFERVSNSPPPEGWPENQRPWFRRAQPNGSGVLWYVETKARKAPTTTYLLHDPYGTHIAGFSGVEWANWDQRGRLITINGGRIFARNRDAISDESRLIIDLNQTPTQTFRPPEWARQWPEIRK